MLLNLDLIAVYYMRHRDALQYADHICIKLRYTPTDDEKYVNLAYRIFGVGNGTEINPESSSDDAYTGYGDNDECLKIFKDIENTLHDTYSVLCVYLLPNIFVRVEGDAGVFELSSPGLTLKAINDYGPIGAIKEMIKNNKNGCQVTINYKPSEESFKQNINNLMNVVEKVKTKVETADTYVHNDAAAVENTLQKASAFAQAHPVIDVGRNIELAKSKLKEQIAEAKGYTNVVTDKPGAARLSDDLRSTVPDEDLLSAIQANAMKHVEDVKNGLTPKLEVNKNLNLDGTVKTDKKELSDADKQAIDADVRKKMEQNNNFFNQQLRQINQMNASDGYVIRENKNDTAVSDLPQLNPEDDDAEDFDFNQNPKAEKSKQ